MPTLGGYTLHAIDAGKLGLDGGAMFGVVPRPLWERRIQPDEKNRIPLRMRCLLLEGHERRILIDNGLGDKYTEKFGRIYAVEDEKTNLWTSLEAAGFAPEDITDVVLTHLHFDHCGGSTTRRAGELQPTFPNATYHVQSTHWDWARDPNPRERASFLAENLEPLAGSEQLNLLDGGGELFPGVELLLVNGHTEAQQLVKVRGPEGTLVYVADLIPTTAHIRLPWVMAYDVRPLVTMEEKAAFLEEALEEGWDLFFEHDPEVAVASLESSDRGIVTTGHRSLVDL